jgi:putative MATE family efflux protein
MLLVTNSIFRGRGDTKTPLYCTFLGNIVNIILDPILIFTCHMGCGGAGAATAISQWVTAVPLLYLLYKSIPFNIFRIEKESLRNAFKSYLNAGGLILLRTIAKISAYAITASAAARLGSVAMAAYALTFNLGFATSQLCEAVSVAAQVLIAREVPFNSEVKKIKVQHVIRRALLAGVLVSGGLSVVTQLDLDRILNKLTNSKEVFEAAKGIMPIVLITQLAKGLTYSTGGIILGGLDWSWSTASMMVASILSTAMVYTLKPTLWNIWLALAVFMSSQVVCAMVRIISKTGPWSYLKDSDRNVVPKTA